METSAKNAIKGGEFLIRETKAQDIFIPEEFNEEQRMMAQTCQDFLEASIYPNIARIDSMEEGLMESIVEEAGSLGLMGIAVPEEYGGMGMNFVTNLLMADIVGSAGSFSTTYGAHTGIGTLPILYYGTEEQKQKYLPKLSAGEWKACYCLTEPNAGSDANSGISKVRLSDDGKNYIINGRKMWITNSGFADIFIVFAKFEGDKNLTAFIVEKDFGGIELEPEEHKLGIKGSSTRQVVFNECHVPLENILSTRENGFKIAVNILNIGRIKLAVGVLGGCRMITNTALKYAKERVQFKQPIASFGAIKHKLAEMAIRIYATEAACYRAGQDIEGRIEELIAEGKSPEEAKLKGVEEFAIECAMMKVYGSEVLDFVADEGLQIYGGMGFSAEAPMERAYRDARISRIYEGTNEINRMLTVDMVMKRALKGQLDLMSSGMKVQEELMGPPSFSQPESGLFGEEKGVLRNLRKAVLMVAGAAAMQLKDKLATEQEILMNAADMMIELYIAESVVLRTEKMASLKGEANCQPQINMAKVCLSDCVDRLEKAGKDAINSFATGDTHRIMMMGLKRYTKAPAVNVKELRRAIADYMIERDGYVFFL